MIGIIGGRGVGKTTMILQRIKEHLSVKNTLYVSADDIYFSEHRLIDLADEFHKNAENICLSMKFINTPIGLKN